jgi:hypothetical protein
MVKIAFLASVIAISAAQSYAQRSVQTTDIFVKGEDFNQCWLDVKGIAHRNSTLVREDEKQKLLQAEHFWTMFGDLVLAVQVQVFPDKNKKGEGGCRISVKVQWDESRIYPANAQRVMSMDPGDDYRVASLIASEVEAMEKARDKNKKNKRN